MVWLKILVVGPSSFELYKKKLSYWYARTKDGSHPFASVLNNFTSINHTMLQAINKMHYGHYVVTAMKKAEELKTRSEDYLAAETVNWAMQVSRKPKIVAVAVPLMSDLNETIDYSGHFALHLVGFENRKMVENFWNKIEIKDGAINGEPYHTDTGHFIIDRVVGYIICKVTHSVNQGDSMIHFGELIDGNTHRYVNCMSTMEV
ncbi:MAG: flavin reductase, partial [Cyclobacteriaceae bacterium]|nr:flavin reductase [Cyclobacteriaceae bacterium]